MTLPFEMVEAQAMALAPSDRARLIEHLVHHLDDEQSIDEAWMQEAMRRDRDMDLGIGIGLPHDQMMEKLRAGLR
jgi:putative addiction module component (TIGR02574 family)